jgi:ABC-type Na+ efflux pump permease subunit
VNEKVRAVMRKELREYRRNKLVVTSMAALPTLFFVLPLVTVVELNAGTPATTLKGAVGSAMLWLLLMPLLLPTIVAGYAVVGERDQGTLEPVLTTPVRKEELLVGKALAVCVPTVSVAYALYAVFLLVVRLAAAHDVVTLVWTPAEIIALAVFAPLLATFSIWWDSPYPCGRATCEWLSSSRRSPSCR